MTDATKYRKIKVLSTKGLNSQVRGIRFEFTDKDDWKEFTFTPASIVMIGVPGYGESALAITTTPKDLPEFEIAVRTAGNNTMALNRLKAGDTAYLRGPIGHSSDLAAAYGKQLVLIAGGIGLAPLRSIIRELGEDKSLVAKLTVVIGAKTPEDIIYKEEIAAWQQYADVHLVVDSADADWTGEIGRIPDLVKKLEIAKDASVIVCGPPVMYQPLAEILTKKGLSSDHISYMLERRMKCGIGKCQHCTCGEKYVCLDGPAFSLTDLEKDWEALL